jgi:hypothetical protein
VAKKASRNYPGQVVFGSEVKLAGKGCQTYALRVGTPFSFFVCQETKFYHFIIVVSGLAALRPTCGHE